MRQFLKNLKEGLFLFLFIKFYKSKYDKKVEEKNKEIISKLIHISDYFNKIIVETTIEEYKIMLKLFRLNMTIYDARVLAFYESSSRRLFTSVIIPTKNNVGFNNPDKVFNYDIPISEPHSDWDMRHYRKYLHNLNTLNKELDLFARLLNETFSKMSTADFIRCVMNNRNDINKCLHIMTPHFNHEERQLLHVLIKNNLSISEI